MYLVTTSRVSARLGLHAAIFSEFANSSVVASFSSVHHQRISGGWRTHGGAEAREQREESTTGPGGQLACPVLLPVVLERLWLPTGISTRAPVIHHVRVHK